MGGFGEPSGCSLAEPWSLGSPGRQSSDPLLQDHGWGCPGDSLSSRVAGQTPDLHRCLSQNTSFSADIASSRLWRPEVPDQGAVDSKSGESPIPGRSVPPSGCALPGPGPVPAHTDAASLLLPLTHHVALTTSSDPAHPEAHLRGFTVGIWGGREHPAHDSMWGVVVSRNTADDGPRVCRRTPSISAVKTLHARTLHSSSIV